MIFVATWTIFESKRSSTGTMFASMDVEADKKDAGNCKMLGRWMNLCEMSGCIVMDAPSAEDAYKWLFNWTEDACHVILRPMLDDNQAREIVLGAPPAFVVKSDSIGMEAPAGHSLFLIHGIMHPDKKDACYNAFANLTEEQDKADPGNCKVLCRYHDLGKGEIYCVAAAKHDTAVVDLQKWVVSDKCFFVARRLYQESYNAFSHHSLFFLSFFHLCD
jgi:hypothetical protein